jgi:hypothetical protein
MPELLTRAEMPNPSPAGWPASNRNGGRIYFGMAADIKSERWPASSRNTRPASIGIRTSGGADHFTADVLPQRNEFQRRGNSCNCPQ